MQYQQQMHQNNNEIGGKQSLLMQSLSNFFKINENMEQLLSIIGKNDNSISLRVIDWFVTNYSKEREIVFTNPTTGQMFNVYDNYKSQLKAYSKRQFDPFCRRTRINFYYKKDEKLVSTVAQLNFFRWMIENYVIDYVRNNIKDIELSMKNFVRSNRESKKNTKKNLLMKNNNSDNEHMLNENIQNDNFNTRKKNMDYSSNYIGGGGENSFNNNNKRSITKHNINTVVSFL